MNNQVSLRELNHENIASVLALSVSESQRIFYPRSNAESIVEGHYPADDDPVWIRAIYAGETPVGLLMTSEAPAQGEYFLWRIMIDAKQQHHGYAAQAVELLIQRISRTPDGNSLITSHLDGNNQASRFFQGLGFSYTGERLGADDLIMRKEINN